MMSRWITVSSGNAKAWTIQLKSCLHSIKTVNIAKCLATETSWRKFLWKKKLSPFCVSANMWIAKDMSNLAWQILDTKTKILRLFAESLLWQSKGNLNRAFSVIAAALDCDDATLKAPLWWFTLPSQRCFHSGPLMEAYMTLHKRQQREDFFFSESDLYNT